MTRDVRGGGRGEGGDSYKIWRGYIGRDCMCSDLFSSINERPGWNFLKSNKYRRPGALGGGLASCLYVSLILSSQMWPWFWLTVSDPDTNVEQEGDTVTEEDCMTGWLDIGDCMTDWLDIGDCMTDWFDIGDCMTGWLDIGDCMANWLDIGDCITDWLDIGDTGHWQIASSEWLTNV